MSPTAEGPPDLGDDLLRASQHIRRGEAQDDPAGCDQLVLPADVVHEDVALAVDIAVEFDQHPLFGPRQVGAAEEDPDRVPDGVLQDRRR